MLHSSSAAPLATGMSRMPRGVPRAARDLGAVEEVRGAAAAVVPELESAAASKPADGLTYTTPHRQQVAAVSPVRSGRRIAVDISEAQTNNDVVLRVHWRASPATRATTDPSTS